MSEMVRHKGIIKRLSNEDNLTEVYKRLVAEGKIEDQIDADFNEDGTLNYIYNDDYDVINGCLFDTSGAPEEYDADEEVAEAERLNETDYRIHIYYYNGGDSPIYEAIEEADAKYKEKTEENVFYAVKRADGRFIGRMGSPAPALYLTPGKAEATLLKHFPGHARDGYKIVQFVEK